MWKLERWMESAGEEASKSVGNERKHDEGLEVMFTRWHAERRKLRSRDWKVMGFGVLGGLNDTNSDLYDLEVNTTKYKSLKSLGL